MPNWCYNLMTITGNIDAIKKTLKDNDNIDGLFKALVGKEPTISDDEYHNLGGWYDSNIGYWGTKWDVSTDEISVFEENNSVSFEFYTAWSPPINFCKLLSEKYSCNVYIKYHESGIGFAGEAEFDEGDLLYENDYEFEDGLKLLFDETN